MSFLKAEWRKLILANYEIESSVLEPYLPYGTELDTWQGKHYVSLVGFMFKNVRMLGLRIPFHVNFEEANLRFYVKHQTETGEWKRGVVFIKEIVPKPALSLVANTLYREHYETRIMRHIWEKQGTELKVEYAWRLDGEWQRLGVNAKARSQAILPDSKAFFITEHYWGYTKIGPQKTYEYQVTHPSWEQYEVLDYDIQVDFSKNYGSNFALLNDRQPASVQLAEGSAITVERKQEL
ncbi:MAG: DUF2071 domain-containing protein [Saprospiraceae bacterium]